MGKFSLKNNFTKEKLAIFISVLGFIFLTFGFTAAFFSYIGHGTGENAVSSDSITFGGTLGAPSKDLKTYSLHLSAFAI